MFASGFGESLASQCGAMRFHSEPMFTWIFVDLVITPQLFSMSAQTLAKRVFTC